MGRSGSASPRFDGGERTGLGQVGRQQLDVGAVDLAQLGRQLVEAIDPAGDQHELPDAVGREQAGGRGADAARGAGHERGVPREAVRQRHARDSSAGGQSTRRSSRSVTTTASARPIWIMAATDAISTTTRKKGLISRSSAP